MKVDSGFVNALKKKKKRKKNSLVKKKLNH